MNIKIKFVHFLFILALISFACPSLSQQASSSQIQGEELSEGERFSGQYEGNYRGTRYEIWIELDRDDPSQFFILTFQQNRKAQVQSALNQYRDLQDYSRQACAAISRATEREREIYGENVSFVAERELWDNTGGLSIGHIASNGRLRLSTVRFLFFGGNDEHTITDIKFDANEELSRIQFLETGFIKKPWNYFRGGPRMNVTKISDATLFVLNTYFDVTDQFQAEFRRDADYCNAF